MNKGIEISQTFIVWKLTFSTHFIFLITKQDINLLLKE